MRALVYIANETPLNSWQRIFMTVRRQRVLLPVSRVRCAFMLLCLILEAIPYLFTLFIFVQKKKKKKNHFLFALIKWYIYFFSFYSLDIVVYRRGDRLKRSWRIDFDDFFIFLKILKLIFTFIWIIFNQK